MQIRDLHRSKSLYIARVIAARKLDQALLENATCTLSVGQSLTYSWNGFTHYISIHRYKGRFREQGSVVSEVYSVPPTCHYHICSECLHAPGELVCTSAMNTYIWSGAYTICRYHWSLIAVISLLLAKAGLSVYMCSTTSGKGSTLLWQVHVTLWCGTQT